MSMRQFGDNFESNTQASDFETHNVKRHASVSLHSLFAF